MSILENNSNNNSKKNKKHNKKFAPVIVDKEFFNYGEAVLESSSSLSVAGLSVAGLSVAGLSVAGLSVASLPEEKIINDIIQEVIEEEEEEKEDLNLLVSLEKSINIKDVKNLDDIVEEKNNIPLELSEVKLLSDEPIDKDIKIKDKKKVNSGGLINNLLIMFGFCK
jgi:Cys-tRNA synthase (O-phospho-L-seryl-tRNA:Cys-tRNA synthase)